MKDLLGVSPSKGNQGTTRGKEKFLLTSVGIEPTASGLDQPLLTVLSTLTNSKVILLQRLKDRTKFQDEQQNSYLKKRLARVSSSP